MGVDRVGERGEDVLAVGGHAGAPHDLLRSPQSFVAAEGVVGVVAGVTVAQRVGLAVFDEAFLAVFADGLQQPVPGVDDRRVRRRPTTGPPGRSATRTRHGPRSARRHRPPPPPLGCNRPRTPPAEPGAAAGTRRAGRRTSRSWPATSAGVSPPDAGHPRADRTVDPTPRPAPPGSSTSPAPRPTRSPGAPRRDDDTPDPPPPRSPH